MRICIVIMGKGRQWGMWKRVVDLKKTRVHHLTKFENPMALSIYARKMQYYVTRQFAMTFILTFHSENPEKIVKCW